ncbi:hypothetical protein NDU88_005069 [Pleurodeles waltl]|uniref:Uncharacterized protein n=1 Tax=Pleurodeles waltl TaxID=8319 RepID=A0AAV7TTR3_PLEWA|nr:hypothetical protein NDU88_005069 [Pleurodeles waltl]
MPSLPLSGQWRVLGATSRVWSCDGSLRADPHNSIACADPTSFDLERNGDSTALIGCLPKWRGRPQVKSGVSLVQKDNGSWSRNSVEPVATEEWKESEKQEDGETGNTEATGQTSALTGQTGAEDPQRGMEDRWLRGAYL